MNQELKAQRISVVFHTIMGFIAGYISLYFSRFWYALIPAILLMLVSGFIAQKTFGKRRDDTGQQTSVQQKFDRKWWMGNGAVIFLLVWIMAWILLFNLMPVPWKII